ncbi:RNA pseudouridine synthase [Chitinimonas prasina]|uniref:RNA pseudouridine synthase n=1 Tax=Chitinimonas prasina TaxID=1434937 RepID=A0ABQ5YJI1_9NEIS|nr:TIGR01621 family pseudouridine synthase [Chitinimonas prasina]GLR15141.1 RNA pseudouridine synthase [Chitinimonas prasina]
MLTLLADEPHFILIDKPAGQSFHREGEQRGVLELLREQTGVGELHAVHRLDQLTSGLLLVAKGAEAAADFGQLFAQRQIRKYYLALSDRAPGKKQGTLSGDMEKGRNGSWRLLQSRQDPAVTQFFTAGVGNGQRAFIVRPLTGRTHQIRVALKALGSPILGDVRYGGSEADRGYLHAYALEFSLGETHYRYACPPREGEHWHSPGGQLAFGRFAEPWCLAWPRS